MIVWQVVANQDLQYNGVNNGFAAENNNIV